MGRSTWTNAGIAVVSGVIGGVVGALLIGLVGIGQHPSQPPPATSNTASAHDQDVALCTTYALVTAGMHDPIDNPMEALPPIAPLRLGLTENPDANPQIRDAISEAIAGFDAALAKGAKPHGLSEPPAYDQATVDAAFDRVSAVCGLGR